MPQTIIETLDSVQFYVNHIKSKGGINKYIRSAGWGEWIEEWKIAYKINIEKLT